VRREVLCDILIEFGVPMGLVRLIEMCLNKIYSKICTDKIVYDASPIQNGLKKGNTSSPLLFNFASDLSCSC